MNPYELKIPIRPLPIEVRALYTPNNSNVRCIKDFGKFVKDEYYPFLQIDRMKLAYPDTGGSWEVYNRIMKVTYERDKHTYFKIADYIKYFQVPDVVSWKELDREWYDQNYKLVESIFEVFKLKKFPFQIEDIALMLMKNRMMLAYEQGLGKSICALAWLTALDHINRNSEGSTIERPVIDRSLVICQQDLIGQWQEEARRFNIRLERINKDNRHAAKKLRYEHSEIPKGNYITHYEFMSRYYRDYIDAFDLIILDEAHKVKTAETLRGKAVRSLKSFYKLCLTGTPFKNVIKDIHYIMGWLYGFNSNLYPYAENEQLQFRKRFSVYETIGKLGDSKRRLIPQVQRIEELQNLLSPAILRRDIKEADIKMVNKRIFLVLLDFTDEQRQEYEKTLNSGMNPTTRDYELRVCTAIYPGNDKLEVLQRIVSTHVNKDEQIIIFSGLVPAHHIYHKLFSNISRIANGDVFPREREKLIASFKRKEFPVLIAGIEAVNSGHSLQCANNVVVTDFPWTASTLDQAIGRVHRVVSEKDINIYLLCNRESFDTKMLDRINMKRESSELVLDGENDFEVIKVVK